MFTNIYVNKCSKIENAQKSAAEDLLNCMILHKTMES